MLYTEVRGTVLEMSSHRVPNDHLCHLGAMFQSLLNNVQWPITQVRSQVCWVYLVMYDSMPRSGGVSVRVIGGIKHSER